MTDEAKLEGEELHEIQRGLRMAQPPEPEALAREKKWLAELETEPWLKRCRGYLRLSGPGYLQSAMTLGGGTAVTSLFAGAAFGYKLLWVAPVAMIMGIVMLSAISWQTLSTGMRPFEAMRRFAGAPLAWGWAIGSLIASIVWHFPQYSLASAVIVDMASVGGLDDVPPQAASFLVLAWAIGLSMLYGRSPRLIRLYERLLKYIVWSTVFCFGAVVIKTGIDDWGALARGFFAFEIPEGKGAVKGSFVVISGLSAAVGINMVFLYPYSLLARGWGREHRRLSRFDLGTGMLLPYVLATSLMVIATANTIYPIEGTRLMPVEAARSLGDAVGPELGRIVFGIGVLCMALSTITLHMLTCGFVCSEIFGWEVGSRRYRLATLLPTPGVLGPILWSEHLLWLAVPTNIICGFFLPIAYVGFILLQRNRRYLGTDTPAGARGRAWLGGMVAVLSVVIFWLCWYTWDKVLS